LFKFNILTVKLYLIKYSEHFEIQNPGYQIIYIFLLMPVPAMPELVLVNTSIKQIKSQIMSRILFFICILSLLSFSSIAQGTKVGPLLDGTSIDYVYETIGGVHVELSNGQFQWHWATGNTGSAPYQARKIGDKIYMIYFKVAGNSSFVTIIFNFDKKIFYTSGIINPKTKNEQVLFETGVIKQLTLKEN